MHGDTGGAQPCTHSGGRGVHSVRGRDAVGQEPLGVPHPIPMAQQSSGLRGGGRHVAEVAARWVPDRGKEMIISAQWLLFGIK